MRATAVKRILFLNHTNKKVVGGKHNVPVHYVDVSALGPSGPSPPAVKSEGLKCLGEHMGLHNCYQETAASSKTKSYEACCMYVMTIICLKGSD